MTQIGRSKGIVWLAAPALAAFAVTGSAKELPSDEARVKTLQYRAMLFDFYQHDYFSAYSKLLVLQKRSRLPHRQDVALVHGSLALGLDMPHQAETVYGNLVRGNAASWVSDIAWFHLGQLRYRQREYAAAARALSQVKDDLPQGLDQERHFLLAQASINLKDFETASSQLRRLAPADAAYVRFNLAVARINENKAKGIRLLEKLGGQGGDSSEALALKDKANLTLGYLHLKNGNAKKAVHFFEKVRIQGAFSNKALLGLGWAWFERDQYNRALVAWSELRQRDAFDTAVQEALLATPFAFAKLSAQRQALGHYQNAVDTYSGLHTELDSVMARLNQGGQIHALVAAGEFSDAALTRRIERMAAAADSRYYAQLFANDEFRETFKHYRDLRMLAANLDRWAQKLAIYDAALAARKNDYRRYGARLQHVVDERRLASMEHRQQRLSRDFERLQRAQRYTTRKHKRRQQAQDHVAQDLVSIQQVLGNLRKRLQSFSTDASAGEANDYGTQLALLRQRVQNLQAKVQERLGKREWALNTMAMGELERKRQHLAAYLVQARYAMAQIYDQAQSGGGGP